METHNDEKLPLTAEEELRDLILAYLPPIPNSEGYECRGTVAEQLAEVLTEENYEKVTPRDTPSNGGVEGALVCIEQLRSRGDQPGTDFADIFQPLADAYRELLAASRNRKAEWQVRMPEDHNSEDGWANNNEVGATYLEKEHGAEVRTRTVTEWQVRKRGQ